MLFWNRNINEKSGSASIARERLQTILANERSNNVDYLDDLKKEMILLVQKYTPASRIVIRTSANKGNMLDIKVSIDNQIQ